MFNVLIIKEVFQKDLPSAAQLRSNMLQRGQPLPPLSLVALAMAVQLESVLLSAPPSWEVRGIPQFLWTLVRAHPRDMTLAVPCAGFQ